VARANLRAVSPGESPPSPPKRRAVSITQAASSGNQRDLLVALRARVAKTVEDPNCPPRDLAALSRRLQELNRDIEAIDAKLAQEAREGADVPDEDWDASAL